MADPIPLAYSLTEQAQSQQVRMIEGHLIPIDTMTALLHIAAGKLTQVAKEQGKTLVPPVEISHIGYASYLKPVCLRLETHAKDDTMLGTFVEIPPQE